MGRGTVFALCALVAAARVSDTTDQLGFPQVKRADGSSAFEAELSFLGLANDPTKFLVLPAEDHKRLTQKLEHPEDEHDEHEHDQHDAPGLIPAKVGVILVTFFVTSLAAAAAFLLGSVSWFQQALHPLSVFAAGAFIGLSMFHLLPEALDSSAAQLIGYQVGPNWYNLTYILLFVGFTLLLLIESVTMAAFPPMETPFAHGCHQASKTGEEQRTANTAVNAEVLAVTPAKEKVVCSPSVLFSTFALVLHSIFEGLAIGLMEDMLTLWIATIIILGHKIPVAVALGVSCARVNMTAVTSGASLFCFCIATPIGVAIGMGVTHGAASASAICTGLSAGVLLYAGCEATINVFASNAKSLGRTLTDFVWFVIGAGFVLGMMMLHLKAGGHKHGVEELVETLL